MRIDPTDRKNSMRRLPSYCICICTLLAIFTGLAAGQQNKNKPARKKPNADSTALRAQRALARRNMIAAEDGFGPGSGYGGYPSTGGGTNGNSSTGSPAGSSAFGGSAFGGSPFGSNLGPFSGSGMGSSQGFGGSAGTAAAAGTGSSAGTGTQTPATGAGTTGGQGQAGNGSTTIPYLNQKVLEFATYNLGKQVGSGVCWELGADALAYANAEPPHGQVFGDQVSLTSMLPGDILEFDNARFVGANYWLSLGAPYHTAIVSAVDGNSIAMLNQNVNGIKLVQITIIHLADLQSGTIAVYRPVAR